MPIYKSPSQSQSLFELIHTPSYHIAMDAQEFREAAKAAIDESKSRLNSY